ncbi:phosphopantetheine adenylyltransferase [Methanobacterium alcaliphilum]|uniref:phosphopantetheine adenylyltransferase n=1 Tax=Methanobacterium alcaliphilum TaxID=392018 RepID=UPI00200A500D|nr:phosphopantetheine adenylyltransferase [Methanobacterium alcaliphilum]MCK9151284.1 phosphopantetheine adenylyltransferase [Methanobacterium alcaliphilum]
MENTNKRIYNKVAVGGTFDKFHKGHSSLLDEAFKVGEEIVIGVTSDAFGGQKGDIDPCDTRMSNLRDFLLRYPQKSHVVRLDDPYGPTIHENDFDAIVVSKETEPTAIEINEIRKKNNLRPIDIVVIEMVSAEDGVPISSTRIRKGEIDRMGHLLKKIRNAFR